MRRDAWTFGVGYMEGPRTGERIDMQLVNNHFEAKSSIWKPGASQQSSTTSPTYMWHHWKEMRRSTLRTDDVENTVAPDWPPDGIPTIPSFVGQSLGQHSRVDQMKRWLKELRASWYSTKSQLWARFDDEGANGAAFREWDVYFEKRRTKFAQAQNSTAPIILAAPSAPTKEERAAPEFHHFTPAPWCEVWAKDARTRIVERPPG